MKMRRQARQAPSKQGSNYLQVSTTTKIAAIYSLSQQTRGASNTLPVQIDLFFIYDVK
jgi:hypothetical protein